MPNQPSLLIVDCDADLTGALCPVLAEHGYACRVAHDGEDALVEVGRTRPDLIIFDRALRRMSGDEFARRLAVNPAHADIPLIILTATEPSENMLVGFHVDLQNYITKPFSVTFLLERIGACLGTCVPA